MEATLTTSDGAPAPDGAEVVDPHDLLDPLGHELEEACAAGDAGVVHEQVDGRMALGDGGGDALHVGALGDVAGLRLRADLGGEPLEPLPPAGEEDAAPAAPRKPARERGPHPPPASRYYPNPN